MAFLKHIRLSMLGYLGNAPGADIWNVNISLAKGPNFDPLSFLDLDPTSEDWDTWAGHCSDWFQRPQSWIAPHCHLSKVKFAFIGEDGRYEAAPIERDMGNVAGGGVGGIVYPFQVAQAITFGTDGDLGRVKGRIFSPAPCQAISAADGRTGTAAQTDVRNSADELLTDLGNNTGVDVLDIVPVVASQGRHNKNGTVRRGPANDPIVRVSAGLVLDTMRSRRNKLQEAPVYAGVDT